MEPGNIISAASANRPSIIFKTADVVEFSWKAGMDGDRLLKQPVSVWCAEHVRQLEGESPFHNLMEVK